MNRTHLIAAATGCLLFGSIALAGCRRPAVDPVPPSPYPVETRGTVFGAKIIDLSLTLNEAAALSLRTLPETDVPATLVFTDEDGKRHSGDVKIRLKGSKGSKRPLDDKPGFKVQLGDLSRFFHLDELTLNNMVQDPTMLHEALGYQVYDAADVKVPRTGYARLTVNGALYGLYLNVETTDKRFLKRVFGDDRGLLYEGAHGVDLRPNDLEDFELDEGEDAERAKLKAFIDALDRRGDGVFYGPEASVDTPSFVRMMATGVVISDWDNYFSANNYRIYWHPSTHRWHFIPTGIDQTFDRWTSVFGGAGLVFQRCLASERCTNDYASAVRDIAKRFVSLGLTERMDRLAAVIDPVVEADPKKPYATAEMKAARTVMREFIAKRPAEAVAALSCLRGGRETANASCSVVIAENLLTHQCLDAAAHLQGKIRGLGAAECIGSVHQRWVMNVKGDSIEFGAIRGGFLFSLRWTSSGAQIIVPSTGRCVAIDTSPPPPARVPASPIQSGLSEVRCADTPAQNWRLKWSVFK